MTTVQSIASEHVSDNVTGYGISYSVTALLSALLVVLKESNESVQGLLIALTGHHWVSHGLLDIIVFVVLGAVLSRRNLNLEGNTLVTAVVGSTIVSGLIITGFFAL